MKIFLYSILITKILRKIKNSSLACYSGENLLVNGWVKEAIAMPFADQKKVYLQGYLKFLTKLVFYCNITCFKKVLKAFIKGLCQI